MTKPYKCRVEYLESTGTQYIDTGVNADSYLGFDVGFKWGTFNTANSRFLGVIKQDGSSYLRHHSSDGGSSFSYFVSNDGTTIQGTATTAFHSFSYNSVTKKFNFDGTEISAVSPATFDTGLNFWLFGRNSNTESLKSYASVKIYSARLYNNDTLVRNFIPVLDNSGRPAMYDQVSGQLFYNQGTGEFTYGRQIIPVEYLESTGTQYIDTGYSSNDIYSNGAFEIICSTAATSNRVVGCGGLNDNNKNINLSFSGGGYILGLYGNQWNSNIFNYNINTKYKIKYGFTTTQQKLYVNDALVETTNYSWNSTDNYPLRIFKTNADTYTKASKIYSFKLWVNGVLVRDFIPCTDENLVPFMFDKVNNTVYLNAGTGQFKVGPNVGKVWGGKKLRRKLALALASLKKKRKYYCEVEYIESNSTRYIDTGYKPNNNTTIECITSFIGAFNIAACRWTGSPTLDTYGFFKSISTNLNKPLVCYYGRYSDDKVAYSYNYVDGTKVKIILNPTLVSVKSVDDTSYISETAITQDSYQSTYNLYIFENNNMGSASGSNAGTCKIYYFKIYENGVLIRDFIPVLDWNMTPCLYDKVTETLFYNQGSGSFTYGREIHYVDYLESTGTQYIDTGITLTNNHSVEVDYQLTSASQNRKGIFGGLIANGARFGALLSPSNNYLEFGYGSTNVFYQTGLPDTNRHVMKQEKNLLYFDGVLTYTFSTATFTQNFTAPLGNFIYTNYNPASAKYYSSKWWDNDTLVRDYIPAIDENGVGFMFDKVTHSCFLNVGTGVFKYPAKEISYLQSTGVQYIDTGYMPNQDTKIELIGKFNNTFPGCLWATRWSQSPNYDTYGAYAENNSAGMLYIYYGRYSSGSFTSVSNATFPHRDGNFISFIQDKNKLDFTNLGTNANWTYTFSETTFQSTRNLTLFYFSSSSAFATKGGYIKSCKIWDNNVMVRDMVTCFKDGVMGMWDKANSVFYQNAGTGTFTVGRILEEEYE